MFWYRAPELGGGSLGEFGRWEPPPRGGEGGGADHGGVLDLPADVGGGGGGGLTAIRLRGAFLNKKSRQDWSTFVVSSGLTVTASKVGFFGHSDKHFVWYANSTLKAGK